MKRSHQPTATFTVRLDRLLWGKTRTATWEGSGLYIATTNNNLKNITEIKAFLLGSRGGDHKARWKADTNYQVE